MIGFGGIVVYCGLIALQLSRAATVNPLTTTDLLARVVMNIFIASLGSVTIIFLFACLVNYCNRPAVGLLNMVRTKTHLKVLTKSLKVPKGSQKPSSEGQTMQKQKEKKENYRILQT